MPAPNTPQDLIDRLRKAERKIEDLSGRMNIRPALNTIIGGSVTIKEGGSLLVEDHNGTDVLSIGRVTPDVDGQPQMATVIRRMDGSLAFAVWTGAATGVQPVRIYDKDSNIIFADETASAGGGLAIPWMPYNVPQPITRAGWGITTSATYEAVLRTIVPLMQPKIYIQVIGAFQSGTGSGQIRLMIGGTQVVEAAADTSIDGVYDVPAWDYAGTPQATTIEVQARRISGTGTYAASCRSLYGRQS